MACVGIVPGRFFPCICAWVVASLFTDRMLQAKEGHLGYSNKARHQFLPIPMLSTAPKEDTEKVSAIAAGDNHLLAPSTHRRRRVHVVRGGRGGCGLGLGAEQRR